jgi:hypothetical protein
MEVQMSEDEEVKAECWEMCRESFAIVLRTLGAVQILFDDDSNDDCHKVVERAKDEVARALAFIVQQDRFDSSSSREK